MKSRTMSLNSLTDSKGSRWEGPLFARYQWPLWKEMMWRLLLPQFYGQLWRFENALVAKRIDPKTAYKIGLRPAYYFKVKFHYRKDSQTWYPHWWRERTAIVRVSKRLFMTHASFLLIFYQYSRFYNDETSVRVKIAR